MKKTVCFILAVVLTMLSIAPCAAKSTSPFADVASDYKYTEAIEFLYNEGITNGYKNDDGAFDFMPENLITRAEFSKLLAIAIAQNADEINDTATTFADLNSQSPDAWAIPYIAFAVKKGIINGYPEDNTFRAANNVSYCEAVKMLVCSLDIKVEPSDPWYKSYLEKADELGLLENTSSDADAFAPRGLVAQLIYNTIKNSTEEKVENQYKAAFAESVTDTKIDFIDLATNEKSTLALADKNIAKDINGGNIVKLTINGDNVIKAEKVYANGTLANGEFTYLDNSTPDCKISVILGTIYEITDDAVSIAPNFIEVGNGGHGILNIDNLRILPINENIKYYGYDSKAIVTKTLEEIDQGKPKQLVDQKTTTRAVITQINGVVTAIYTVFN